MATRFTLPHIDISAFVTSVDYSGQGGGGSSAARIRQEHGSRLLKELNAAFEAADAARVLDDRLAPPTGS